MREITPVTNFARIMQCGDCARGEPSAESRPDYSNRNYAGASISNYNNSGARYL